MIDLISIATSMLGQDSKKNKREMERRFEEEQQQQVVVAVAVAMVVCKGRGHAGGAREGGRGGRTAY